MHTQLGLLCAGHGVCIYIRATCSAAAAALPTGPKENFGRIEDGELGWTEVLGWDDWCVVGGGSRRDLGRLMACPGDAGLVFGF